MFELDSRESVVESRLKKVRRVIAVSGCKGGVGKSSVACALALMLSEKGYRAGLLDLDFCSPSQHLLLGVKKGFPKEENGIVPPKVNGISFMSIVYFTERKPVPLRGSDISNAIIELLAITQWPELDFLIIDMPPGLSDATLETIRLVKKAEFLVITTGSALSIESTEKLLKMLSKTDSKILGVIENMSNERKAKKIAENHAFLDCVPFDQEFEKAIGFPEKILKTVLAKNLGRISEKVL